MNIDFLQPRRWLLLILLLTGSTALQQAVACTTTASDINLGTTSSLTLPTTTSQAAGAGGLTCAGSLQLLTGVYLRATLLSNTLVLTGDQGGSVPFTVYSDSGYTQAMLTGQTATLAGANLLAIGGSGISVPLYARTQLGANVPAGTYTGTISVRWYWAICPSGLLNICTWDTSPGVVQPTGLGCVLNCTPTNWGTGELAQISIKLIVTKACQLSTLSAVDFGAQALVSQFAQRTQTVVVRCTNTEGFTLGFGNGQNYQAPWRQLASGNNRLRYNIYRTDGTTIVNTAAPFPAIGTGASQSFDFKAIIDPTQANVPVGTYIDNVVLTVSY